MANVFARGEFSISINSRETEAKLVFTPNPQSEVSWDVSAIGKLIGEHRLAPMPSPIILEPFIKQAARAKEPIELMLFQGLEPEEIVPEQVGWEPLEVPAEIAPYMEEILGQADDPLVWKIRIERTKRETLVMKPNKLPFLPPKEEVEVVWDRKEIKEQVTVDPQVQETRYAQRNQKLGIIFPAKFGKPGKSVFGKPIPPKPLPNPEFFLGAGLRREKSEVWSVAAGILRIGANWADVVPFSKPGWEVHSGSDGVTLYLQFSPGDSRFAPPKAEEILAAAEAKAQGMTLISLEEIAAAIQESLETGEEILALPLSRVQEALAEVRINADKTQAVLHLQKGLAGARPLEMKAISQAIKDSAVQGINVEKLKAALQQFMSSGELSLDYTLAEGWPATRGANKEVVVQVATLDPVETENIMERLKKSAAYRDLQKNGKLFALSEDIALGFVEQGTQAATMYQGSTGEAGKDIFGKTLPALPGNDPQLHIFQGLYLRGDAILAGRPGLLMVRLADSEFWGQILDYRDATIAVNLSEDGMEAAVDLVPEFGAGSPLNRETLKSALADAGVVRGIDQKALETALHTAKAKGKCKNFLVARGEPPVAQGGSSVKWLIDVRPNIRIAIEQGIPLAELYLIEEGRSGYDVLGTELSMEQAPQSMTIHDNSVFEMPIEGSDTGKYIISARAGELTYDGSTLRISNRQGIRGDVGPGTGNINFPGEVRVAGKVNPGFSVIGKDDVYIAGTADAALISSGGKVVVLQGINGEGKGVIRARKHIEAAYVDKATLMAVEDITIKSACTLSNIKTNGKLLLSGDASRLVGGICEARVGIDAMDIGSEDESRTEISFGQDYLVKDQIEVTERDIEKARAYLEAIEKKIKQVMNNPPLLAAAREEKVKYMKLLEQLTLKVFTLREKFEEHHDSEIRIRGTVYPGVVMESHARYYEIIQKRSKVVFYFNRDTGRITEKPLVEDNSED